MGFRFRKSFGKGPFRVTVSKSGVGYSVGGKGFRVTKKAGGGMRTTASIPGTGISYVKDYSDKKSAATVSACNSVSAPSPSENARPSVERREDNKYRYCRFCLKAINNDDDVCPYCKKSQITGKSTKSGGSKAGWVWAILIVFLLSNCNSGKSEDSNPSKDTKPLTTVSTTAPAIEETAAPVVISRNDTTSQITSAGTTYVLNTDSKKFHYSSCSFAPKASSSRTTYTGTRAEVIAKGYSPCGHCDP